MGEGVQWHDAAVFKRVQNGLWFDFARVSPAACETLAQVLLTLGSLAKPIWHAVEVQPGHSWQAGLYSGLEFGEVLQQVLFGKPLSAHFQLLGSTSHGAGIWLDSAFGWRGLSILGTSFEGVIGRDDNNLAAFWLTTFLGDAIRTVKPVGKVDILPNVVLTFVTLINSGRVPFDGGHGLPSNPSANHRVQKGITKSIDKLFELWLHSVYPRDSYSIFLWNEDGIGDRRLEAMLGHWFGASCGIAILSGLTGSVIVQTIAWVEQWDRLGLTIKDSFLRFFFQYWITNYLKKENSTDKGRYRPGGGGAYRGYPEKTAANPSPYRLPMPAGVALCIGQANQGLFSHNFIANTDFVTPANSAPLQTYAYDFSHQFREPIACVRDGTVVGNVAGQPNRTFDGNPDTTSPGDRTPQNILTIRHATIDPVHDVLDGAPVQTYSVYLHLANNGIRDAPQFGGVLPPAGTPVTRGQLIALAGDTGMSFHNHLHLHVVADDGTGNPGDRSVPFVFDDVDGNGGVPKSISWYRSGNG
jgi:murein DD-endopeptidase MepM/ murein hydrolase activator NlpD